MTGFISGKILSAVVRWMERRRRDSKNSAVLLSENAVINAIPTHDS